MGNTASSVSAWSCPEDHPHIHGEYIHPCRFFIVHEGSPPHTWGILSIRDFAHLKPRITPTYMGNTLLVSMLRVQAQDHPHIHGEYLLSVKLLVAIQGSPPHTWGIPGNLFLEETQPRITPTYMGNTDWDVHKQPDVEDHPHIHGEYLGL